VLAVAFWASVALLGWVYAGYPIAAWAAGRLRPVRLDLGSSVNLVVTVGIAAFNEARQLEARVLNALEQEVPFELEVIVASDGSTDATPAVLAGLGGGDPRVRTLDLVRGGQTSAQRHIFEAARGDVVVLTDAETRFAPGCLAALVAPFADPHVGCTTGHLVWLDESRTETARNEGAYWRYEQLVRRLESRAGWLTAVTGALLAVRRSAYRAVPDHASMDHLLPLHVRDQGLLVLAVPEAQASDRSVAGLREQFRNRTRTATRGIRSNLSMAGRLTPWRHPSASLAIWSHKLLRWATPLLGVVALLAAAGLAAGGSPAYLVPLMIAAILVGLGLVALALRRRGRAARWASLPLAIVVVNAAFLVGWANVIRGRRIGAWHRTDWAALPSKSEGNERSA
jgi:cellulose synthase/poly-beta-1,6-N-acetylglucosamine synthase-like glycosyltransferase